MVHCCDGRGQDDRQVGRRSPVDIPSSTIMVFRTNDMDVRPVQFYHRGQLDEDRLDHRIQPRDDREIFFDDIASGLIWVPVADSLCWCVLGVDYEDHKTHFWRGAVDILPGRMYFSNGGTTGRRNVSISNCAFGTIRQDDAVLRTL